MLELDGEPFTTGRATYLDDAKGAVDEARVFVRVKLEQVGVLLFALDTGSPWCVLDPEVAEAIGAFEIGGEPQTLLAWGNKVAGKLVRLPLTLLAEQGDSLDVSEVLFFVSRDTAPGRRVLGYSTFLSHIRIGLDPGRNAFHFGPAER